MIIYGWGYFNRRNYTLNRGQCPKCGSYGYRQSYESTRFATLYFIPVIPLGTQKITGQCPSCKESLGMSRGKWRKLKKTEIPKAIDTYEANPADTEATRDLISCLVTCQDKEKLRHYGADIEAKHAGNEEVIGFLAMAYSMLCLDEDADRLYLETLDNNPSDDLVEQSDLHMQAKDLPRPSPPNRWLQSIPVLIVPLIILFFVGGYIGDGVSPTLDDATLVNGLSTSYTVLLNGEEYTLKGNSYRRIDNLKYGENTLEPVAAGAPFVALTFTIDVPMKDRMTSDHAAIVNPDQTAVIFWERDEYTTKESNDYSYELDSGQTYYHYGDIDFYFVEYPEVINLPSAINSVYKTRLSTLNGYSDIERVEALINHNKVEACITFLTNKLKYEPDASGLLSYATYVLPSETVIDLIDDKLDAEPVLIEYHRQYQNALESSGENEELIEEYRQRLDKNPGNHALTYLLARIEDDPKTSIELLKEAYSGEGADGYAAYSLAYYSLLTGDPEKAEKLISVAIKRAPSNPSFPAFQESIWVANNNHEALAKLADKELQGSPYNIGAFYKKLTAYQMKNPSGSAEQMIDSFANRLVQDGVYESERIQDIRFQLLAHANQLTNDASAFKTNIVKTDAVGTDYLLAVLDGRLADAHESLESNELDTSGTSHLLLYTLAMNQGNTTLAETCLKTAKEHFSLGTKDTRKWADWLEGDEAPSVSQLVHTCQNVNHHYAVLVAFAQRFPDQAETYMQHARKICYEKDFTYLAMQPLMRL